MNIKLLAELELIEEVKYVGRIRENIKRNVG